MMNQGELHCRRGMEYFESGQNEQAVLEWIETYEAGYEKELVLAAMYECFIQPNEQEFQENYAKNAAGISKLSYSECVLDFIPACDTRFYIFDKEEQKFCGLFAMENLSEMEKKSESASVLYTDEWDIRKVISDMNENGQNKLYLLIEDVEQKFMSFCKLPHFKELYLDHIVIFRM